MADNEEIALLRRLIAEASQEPQRGTPEYGVTHAGGLSGHAVQGALFGFGDEALARMSSVLGVQPDGEGGANWFDYSRPRDERYQIALEQIRNELGEYREENPVAATGAQIAGGVTTAVAGGAAAAPARAATAVGRGAQVVGAGAVGGAVEGFGSGEGGLGNRLQSAGQGAVFGAVAAPLIGYPLSALGRAAERVGGRAMRRVFTSRRMFDPDTGQLTEAGQRAVRNLGQDPEQLTIEMRRALGESLEGVSETATPSPQVAERMAVGRRFDVPLTRGQATGDVTQTAMEENFRAGTRGQSAFNAIDEFDRMQGEAVERARAGIVPRSADADRIDAAEGVIAGVRRMADDARQAGRAAYEALEGAGAAIDGSAVNGLASRIDNAVRIAGGQIDDSTPNAREALNSLGRLMQGGERGSVPFMSVERARQRLLRLRRAANQGANGADQIAMGEVVDQFDNWLDDTISAALQQGDEGVLSQAKEARELWARYRSTFLGRDGPANFIRRIVEDELSPNQVAGWIMGSSRNMGRGQTSSFVRRLRDILGEDSPEFNAIRVAVWDQITSAPEGARQPGPARIAQQVSNFVSSDGRTLARELFSDDQMRTMREFVRLMRTLEPPARSTNPSGTGYEVRRMANEMRNLLLGGMATSTGGPLAGVATQEGVERAGGFVSGVQARAATRGIQVRPPSLPAAVGAGVATGAAAQNQGASLPSIPDQRGPR